MKIGLIADIHGNVRALDAVLKSAPGINTWICGGDVVGYYPDVNEVCEALRRIGALTVRGNHDAYVAGHMIPSAQKRPLYRTDWTRQNLEPKHLDWISSLPVQLNLNFKDWRFMIRHASPWDEETYLYPDSHRLSEIKLEGYCGYIFGHTHWPMVIKAGEGYIINPGSVGQPRDYNSAASYAIVEIETGKIELRRAPYDVTSYQQHLLELGWPESSISILSRSRT